MTDRLRRGARAFGHFWWDFLIGDTPEFALATAVIIALAYLLDEHVLAATVVLPLLTATFLLLSTYRGRRQTPERPAAGTAASPPVPPAPPKSSDLTNSSD